jgi:hypothetical protein
MFEKLNQLVKENSKKEVFLSAGIAASSFESATHEASGVIIDILKSQLDNGKAKDLMSFFKGKKAESDLLLKMMINKYANRLNKYYTISSAAAKEIAEVLIPTVVKKFVAQTGNDKKEDKGIFALLNYLSGYTVNFEEFFLKIDKVQMA